MESSPASASSPRASRSDVSSSAEMHLQLVGCSDVSLQKAISSPTCPIPVGRAPPSPSSASSSFDMDTDSGSEVPTALSASALEAMRDGVGDRSGADIEGDTQSRTQESNSTEWSSSGNPSPQGSSIGKPLGPENPSPRGSCTDNGACSSFIKGFDKKAVCIKPSLMKKPGIMGLNPTVAVKKCGKLGPAGVTISISHTEKETIVHTDCSNFREVVHQLTGASGNDGTLLPVTVSSRARVNLDDTSISLSKGADMGPRKPVPTKLFERRKSSKTLERITTNCRELPPMVPSPVTPLATDFERISLPMTPVTSPISVQQEHDHIQKAQQTAAQLQIGNLHDLHFYSSYNQSSTYGHANLTSVHPVSNDTPLIFGGHHNVPYNSHSQRGSSIEDSIIAEKGFFLHPQRPKTSEPPLLSLFPESPRG